ncbi:RfeD [Coccidioides immitis H538.4]|uniref:RfeD n=1 Tax=Coccidioides immitis H538.4 TaxID=396776 RepID=A0A0J8U8S7_COCIT|nr:RfeD [Coccidioides immitis H538.4]
MMVPIARITVSGSHCSVPIVPSPSWCPPIIARNISAFAPKFLNSAFVEKRYRSMQEHIRRAHPNYYIPKLPATEESFQLMVNTPPDQRPHQQPPAPTSHPRRGPSDRDIFARDQNSPATPRTLEEAHPAAATAAVALAQLQHHRLMSEWDSEVDAHSDSDIRRDRMRSSVELPPLRDHFKQESIPPFSPRPRELLPSILAHSPPGRSSTLPPIQRREKIQRARKGSLTQARKGKHERTRSKEYGRRSSINERKALSTEPQTAAWRVRKHDVGNYRGESSFDLEPDEQPRERDQRQRKYQCAANRPTWPTRVPELRDDQWKVEKLPA